MVPPRAVVLLHSHGLIVYSYTAIHKQKFSDDVCILELVLRSQKPKMNRPTLGASPHLRASMNLCAGKKWWCVCPWTGISVPRSTCETSQPARQKKWENPQGEGPVGN